MMFEEKSERDVFVPPQAFPRRSDLLSVYREMSLPAGRFKSPLSITDKIKLWIGKLVLPFLPDTGSLQTITAPVPLQWQLLINYLYQAKILKDPSVVFGRLRHDSPKLISVHLQSSYDPRRTDARDHAFEGRSAGFVFERAISTAVGEVLERYFGTIFKREEMLHASPAELMERGIPHLRPQALCAYEDWQKERFLFLQHSENTPFRWVKGVEYISGRSAYIPAQLAYWLYQDEKTNEPYLYPLTTNGSAGHFTSEEAILSGLHEYIQRDAFLIYWLNTLSPRRIEIEAWRDDEVQAILRELSQFGISAYFLNLTTDIPVPVGMCVLIQNEGKESLIAVGAATGENAKECFIKSYIEAVLTLSYIVERGNDEDPCNPEEHEPFTDQKMNLKARMLLWQGAQMYQRFSFFISGERQSVEVFESLFVQKGSPKNELRWLCEELQKKGEGYELYVYEMKDPILEKIGYHVVKTIVPALVPLHLEENMVCLAATRLRTVPGILGYHNPILNIYPHPFP